jgi:hypothetical protein
MIFFISYLNIIILNLNKIKAKIINKQMLRIITIRIKILTIKQIIEIIVKQTLQ